MVHIQGRDLFTIPTPVSITEYLHRRLMHDAMDGPLTDYESAGSEKEEGLALKTTMQKLMTRVRLYITPKG